MSTASDLVNRVTGVGLCATGVLTAVAWWVAGAAAALGTAGGGVVALLNFRWLAAGAVSLVALPGAGVPSRFSLAGAGLRHIATFGALALLLSTGWAHPLGVVAGVSVLPPILIAYGFGSAKAGC